MSTEVHPIPEHENNQKASSEETGNENQKNTSISLPNIERPEGPFEHSAETAGWTKEEQQEKAEQEQQKP